MKSISTFLISIGIFISSFVALHSQSLQDDDIAQWAELYRQGELSKLSTLLTDEVKNKDSNSDYAGYVWCAYFNNDESKRQEIPALERSCRLRDFRTENNVKDMMAAFSREEVATWDNAYDIRVYYWNLSSKSYDLTRNQLLLELLKNGTTDFNVAWNLAENIRRSESLRSELIKILDDENCCDPQIRAFLIKIVPYSDANNHHSLEAFYDVFGDEPDDYEQSRFLADQLRLILSYEESAKHWERVSAVDPYGNAEMYRAKMLYKTGEVETAEEIIRKRAFYKSGETGVEEDDLLAQFLSELYRDAGEWGKAREVISKRIENGSKFHELYNELYLNENASKQYTHAAEAAKKSFELKPESTALSNWMNALYEAGDIADVWDVFNVHRENPDMLTERIYWLTGNALIQMEAPDIAIEMYREALRHFPESAWLKRSLGNIYRESGNLNAALTELQESIDIRHDNLWAFYRLADSYRAYYGNDATTEYRAQIVKPFNSIENAWRGLAYLRPFESIQIFENARTQLPNEYWPIKHLTLELIQVEAPFEASYEVFDNAIDNHSNYNADARIDFFADYTETITTQAQNEFLEADQLEFALALLEEFKELGGSKARYHYNRFRLLQSAGLNSEAASELSKALDFNPDNETYLYSMFLDDISGQRGSERFIRYHTYVERNPWDGSRVAGLAHRHLRWGGSALIALKYYERLSEISPDHLKLDEYNSALQTLGNRAASYKFTYFNNSFGPSASDRYIGWYNSTRLQAQQESVDFQLMEDGSIQIFHPNGIVATYRDHPVTGKPLYIQHGAAFVKAEYNEMGYLTRIEASSGSSAILNYDEHFNIANYEINEKGLEKEQWFFEYDDQNRIIKMTDKGEHTLILIRNEAGDIEDREASGGHETTLKVSQAVDKLTGLTRLLDNKRYSDIPELPYLDETEEKLRDEWMESEGEDEAPTGIAYVTFMLKNLGNHQKYTSEIKSVLDYMAEEGNVEMDTGQRLQIVGLWYQFLKETRLLGVDQTDWDSWQKQVAWLEQQDFRRQLSNEADALRQTIQSNPIELLPAARWVPESAYMNPAHWTAHAIYQLGQQLGVSIQVNSALIRYNGDVVIGTSHGLAINRKGFWELLVFDDVRGQFRLNATPTASGNASSHILALAEDEYDDLWIGTQNGLLYLNEEYTDRPRRWRTESDGLPHPAVHSFLFNGDDLYGATSGGLILIDTNQEEIIQSLDVSVKELNGSVLKFEKLGTVVSNDGIYLLENKSLVKIHDSQTVRSAIISADGSQILFLEGNTLYRKPIDGSLNEKYAMSGQQDIVRTTDIQKLRYLPIPDSEPQETGIAILTDQGITALHSSNFEYLPLSDLLTDRRVQINDLITFDSRVVALLQNSVLDFNPESHTVISEIRPTDMVYAPAWDFTFMASGYQLLYTDSEGTSPSVFDYVSSSVLALSNDGGLLTNDGSEIVYYDGGTFTRQLLFSSDGLAFLENASNIRTPEIFNSILHASDGTIWATTPSTVFRLKLTTPLGEEHKEGLQGELFVYSMFKDPEEFPVASDMISRVFETKDGDIWVVASDEGHRRYMGVRLDGGLFKFTGDGFEKISQDMGSNWFITSYTQMDDQTALAGTTRGFALHQGSQFRQLWNLEDPSYMNLRSEMPMLWLGTKGAKFGENTYLFGSAGGVVLYNNSEWYYPENLNRLLPEDIRFGERGGRHIHSIAANKSGTIYVSTDRGLLMYDLGDNDDALLFQKNGMYEQAVRHQQRLQLIQESDVLMDALKENPELRNLITEMQAEKHSIEELQDRLSGDPKLGRIRGDSGSGAVSDRPTDAGQPSIGLNQQLEDRRRNYESLTRLLELEHHGAFQMLQLNPLDVAQLRHQLGEDEHIVVYIPTEKKLTIQLINKEEIRLIEVEVSADELRHLSMLVADKLAGRDFSNRRTIGSSAIAEPEPDIPDEKLTEYLSALYEFLLRPLETFVSQDDLLYIVPTGSLNYLPFASLVRSTIPRVEYAVQRYTMGVLPSMYLLDLVLRHQPSTSRNAMIIGDPDGSLPGARKEAEDIYGLLRPSSPILLGNAADRDAILRYAADARVVHFATHGKLNPEEPARSYLLLANNQQLGVADVMQLPLKNTDLVVLSACETGLGTTGLEYATLARAFAHAGAPSILATLWEVPDTPSSILITTFYRNLNSGMNVFRAMSEAQRTFLSEEQRYQSPVNWAGYVPFGKP